MEELEFTRNTYTSVFRSKTALTRPRNGRAIVASLFLSRSRATSLPSRVLALTRGRSCLHQAFFQSRPPSPSPPFEYSAQAEKHAR